jgi:Tfp pilus assembly protein PilN
MLRINLLPREVLDRQRFEGWYRYIFIISTGLVLIVLLVAAGLYLLVQQKNDELQTARDNAQKYAEQGKAFDIFEKKEKELADRQAIAQTALADRLNLGKIAEEVSLVLPDEVWLDSMTLDENTGMSFIGNTPRSTSQSLNESYKSVARTLVRLNMLPEINDVWLSSATNGTWSAWEGSSVNATAVPTVGFTVTGKILKTPESQSADPVK